MGVSLNDQEIHAFVESRLSEYIDNRLPEDERARIESHLKTCDRCSESQRSLLWTVNLLRQTPVPALPRSFALPVPVQAPVRRAGFAQSFGLAFAGVAAVLVIAVLSAVYLLGPGQGAQQAAAPQVAAQFTLPASGTLQVAESIATPTAFPEAKAADQTQPPTFGLSQIPTAAPPLGFAPAPATPLAQPASPSTTTGTAQETPPSLRNLTTLAVHGLVISETASVRDGPDTSYREIIKLNRGDAVNVIGREPKSGWLAVRLDTPNSIGWVDSAEIGLLVSEPLPTIIVPTRTPVSR
jgi:hypothetical protein